MPKLDFMSEQSQAFIEAYMIHEHAPPLRAGRMDRAWMDHFAERQPYRCLPLSMANATGWELTCPFPLDIEWNGGPDIKDILISSPEPSAHVQGLAQSHFRAGIVTFHTGYIFKTAPGWALACAGPPNWPKDGIYAFSGLIETDWLPYPFTMNWQMTRPGKVRFETDEPFCFLTISRPCDIEPIGPRILSLDQNPQLKQDYGTWNESREDFIARLAEREASALSQGWQRHYMRGENPGQGSDAVSHVTKRRLKSPQDCRTDIHTPSE